jgi:hypothetical protein
MASQAGYVEREDGVGTSKQWIINTRGFLIVRVHCYAGNRSLLKLKAQRFSGGEFSPRSMENYGPLAHFEETVPIRWRTPRSWKKVPTCAVVNAGRK